MNAAQKELADKHGTPEEFSQAVWRSCDSLEITVTEAVVAIAKYDDEFREAGLKKERTHEGGE